MTRIFENGTALVDGIEADASGEHSDLPLLSEKTRRNLVKRALKQDDRETAEKIAARSFVQRVSEGSVIVHFVAPPDWEKFGEAIWSRETGETHAVFRTSTLLVDDVAVPGCVGLPFENEQARRECAAWCLRNALNELAEHVARTPVGGGGPWATWPGFDLEVGTQDVDVPDDDTLKNNFETQGDAMHLQAGPDRKDQQSEDTQVAEVVNLFGGVYGVPEF